MKIAVTFGPMCLRRPWDLERPYDDRRGLTGSELGFLRICEELRRLGHAVTLVTQSEDRYYHDMPVFPPGTRERFDVAIAINEPCGAASLDADRRACCWWLNDVSFCAREHLEAIDLFVAASEPLRERMIGADMPLYDGSLWRADAAEWRSNPLGCDPDLYGDYEKIPGRVVYCSSPDRGLHRALERWPEVHLRVPGAELHIYYALAPWLSRWDTQPYWPPIEGQRARAYYISEALLRLEGHGVVVHDAVSRHELIHELDKAEVLAYPCDPVTWTEGFSCALLEGCAARSCPVATDADALGAVYGHVLPLTRRGDWDSWTDAVVDALTRPRLRAEVNERARAFALEHTWRAHAERLMQLITGGTP